MFDPKKFIAEKTKELKVQVKGKAIIAVSGGVDSTTAAVLTHKAIGNNLVSIMVDTGFM
jgi:GMP synthase (glutamine-hydrolysing)